MLGGATSLAGSAACPEWGSGNALGATFTENAELNADIAVFVQTAADLRGLTAEIEAEVVKACTAIGTDLGLSAEDMKPEDGPTGKLEGACEPVKRKIDSIMLAAASANVQVSFTPPKCEANASVQADCNAKCNVDVDPGQIVANCEPAKLSGKCEGTCKGQCDGTCNGTCDGECTATDAEGNCTGQCNGTCNGTCEATCHAKCEGEWKAPRCEADVQGPSASADCQASCDARADFKASCTPPSVDASAAAEAAADIQKLVATLKVNLPALINAQVRLGQQLSGDIKTVIDAGARLKGEMGDAGAKAVACVGAAVAGLAEVSAKVSVSVKVSASISGSVNANAGGSASAG